MEGIIGDSTRVIATCGTLSLGLRSVNLFLLHSSYTASTLATGGYQIGSEKLIEILHVFVLETWVRMWELFSKTHEPYAVHSTPTSIDGDWGLQEELTKFYNYELIWEKL